VVSFDMTKGIGSSIVSATGHASGTGTAQAVGVALSQSDLLAILNRQTEAGNALVVAGRTGSKNFCSLPADHSIKRRRENFWFYGTVEQLRW
jgi:hypothetical protein